MDWRIVFNHPVTGRLTIFAPAARAQRADETEAEFQDRCARLVVPAGADYRIKSPAEIPADKTYRNAWRLEAGAIVEDLEQVRALAADRLRRRIEPRRRRALDLITATRSPAQADRLRAKLAALERVPDILPEMSRAQIAALAPPELDDGEFLDEAGQVGDAELAAGVPRHPLQEEAEAAAWDAWHRSRGEL